MHQDASTAVGTTAKVTRRRKRQELEELLNFDPGDVTTVDDTVTLPPLRMSQFLLVFGAVKIQLGVRVSAAKRAKRPSRDSIGAITSLQELLTEWAGFMPKRAKRPKEVEAGSGDDDESDSVDTGDTPDDEPALITGLPSATPRSPVSPGRTQPVQGGRRR